MATGMASEGLDSNPDISGKLRLRVIYVYTYNFSIISLHILIILSKNCICFVGTDFF